MCPRSNSLSRNFLVKSTRNQYINSSYKAPKFIIIIITSLQTRHTLTTGPFLCALLTASVTLFFVESKRTRFGQKRTTLLKMNMTLKAIIKTYITIIEFVYLSNCRLAFRAVSIRRNSDISRGRRRVVK